MQATTISRRAVALAIGERLLQVTNATGYFGQIGALNGLPGATVSPPADPPPKGGPDKRVQPYFVLEPGAGTPRDELDLADTVVDLTIPFVVRAAAGDVEDLLALIDRIDALLYRWAPLVAGIRCGPLRPPPGAVPPLLVDDSFKPARHYTPLAYQLTAHT